ncbi:hypothetical protein BVG16_30105 [Paenibacillus selenitireducens]|uniref:G5 domain-containing protein n=1 Tax=Paenibacillus selenitireducens TaxID=1324314 RepID=A0A1T2X051_9BACL|nr:3D domain-containing protein [Paenibacillus selenitireducens]OPA73201.1 hypothetical protein BVG16_30105 [Paenibacillus selenitireducens]
MGAFQNEESPSTRSSSMSFALRWMHDNLRLISLVALVSLAMTFMLMVVLNVYAKKEISLVVDGQHIQVETTNSLLQHLLDEQAIQVGAYDKLSMPLQSKLKDGDSVEIWRAIPVLVTADGQTKTMFTTEKTVDKVIAAANIKLSDQDKVTPALDATISNNMDIKITRVETKTESREVTVPFNLVKKPDATLLVGKQKLVQEGKSGVVVQKIQKVFEDGQLVSSQMVDKSYSVTTKHKIVAYGTKKPEAKVRTLSLSDGPGVKTFKGLGKNIKYSKKLSNVTLTAYSSEEEGIGTRTASGTTVSEGRTIAVDKNVIPIGWWVYIEGVGFRRAEDTGSAIKGNKIDVYIDSLRDANKFGRKRGHTVYVIGPVKPSAS